MRKLRKIASHRMYSPHLGIVRDPLLTFDELTGELLSVEYGVEDIDSRAGVEFYSGMLVPGPIDCNSSDPSLRAMAAEIRHIVENLGQPLEKALEWATIRGAEALGLEAVMGSFEPGKRPGAVVVTGENCTSMRRIIR